MESRRQEVILVIDDDAEVRWATVRTLQQAGFLVLAGGSAEDATTLAKQYRPALVLLDVVLPDGSGVDVARELKRDPMLTGVFVILVSGMRTDPREQAEGLSKGLADGYIARPFNGEEFLARVDAFLRIRDGLEALRKSEERYRSILGASPDGIIITDLKGRIVEVSPAVLALAGYDRADEMLGHPVADFIAAGDRDRAVSNLALMFRDERPRLVEYRGLHRQGHTFDIEVHGTFIRDAQGLPANIVFVVRDITTRKRTEAALLESEASFRDLFESAPVASHEFDKDGVIRRVNQAECRLLGYEPEELLGRPVWEILAPEEREASRISVRRKLSGDKLLQPSERKYVRRDGRELWLEFHDTLVLNAHGETIGIRTALIDITARVAAEKAARERADTLAAVVANALNAIVMIDGEGRVVLWNPAAEKIFGYTAAEMVGQPVHDLLAPGRFHPAFQRGFPVFQQTGEGEIVGRVVELTGRRKDGSEFPIEISLSSVKSGREWQAVGVIRDISERKLGDAALRESELRFRTLTEDAPIAISMSRQDRIVYANPAYVRMFGFERTEELYGSPTIDRFAPRCRAEVLERINRRAQGLPVARDYETSGQRADGSEFPMLVAVIGMEFAEGPAQVAFITDLTESKRAETDRLRLEEQFRQAQKMESVGRLAGGVAHDFNNLLTVINGYSQLLLSKLREGDPLRGNIDEIHRAGERAAGLTRQLLAFSRKQVLEPRRLDVNRVVDSMRPMLERLVGEDVELRVALHAEGGTIHADPHQLEQVIMNLVVNARDAMPGVGKLLVETAVVDRDEGYARLHTGVHAGRYVMLAVSDTGVGMDSETKNHIFEPFFTTKGVGKGTGLGLSMVQGIVAQSGGYVEVYSEPGHGTTFKIYLPALSGEAADEGSPVTAPAAGGKESVLVVEDQLEVRKYAVTVLKSYGYQVMQVEDATEALQVCQKEPIDLVLTDVVMPNVSGRELADQLAKIRPGIKVLFMSGYTDSVIEHHGVLDEGAKFIQKPFNPADLAAKVRSVLGPPVLARIMVADDEASVRGFLRKVLEDGGYEVIEAADGRQALKQARSGQLDMVITDLIMPEQEGIETILALRKEVPNIGIIAISGAFGGQFLKMAQTLGADAVLKKPLKSEFLLARVAEVLKARR